MTEDVSKLCSDFLRKRYPGLKASHARELVAAFFGYKSHASLLADKNYPVADLLDAAIIVPDILMLSGRSSDLVGLPPDLHRSYRVMDAIIESLRANDLIDGEIWDCHDIGEYVKEYYLPEHVNPDFGDELADVTEPINAIFEDIEYDDALVDENSHSVAVTVAGTYSGYTLDEENFNGDTIDVEVYVSFNRVAGRIGFDAPEVAVSGEVSRANFDLYESAEAPVTS